MTGRSSCPECGTILRIRDRSFVGRRVTCPECKTALRIEAANEDGSYPTRRLTEAELNHSTATLPNNSPKPEKTSLPQRVHPVLSKWINSPLTAAWLLAFAVMALIAVLTLAPKVRRAPTRANTIPVVAPPSSESDSNPEPANEDKVPPGPEPAQKPAEKVTPDVTVIISALEPANISGPLTWPPVANPTPDPVVAEVRPTAKIDIESKMAQRFPLYKQPKPVSRRELLESLQEQLGAPIHYDVDDLGDAGLNSTVTFELENTTIGGVIKTVADGAHWDMTIEDTGLRLTKRRSQQP